MIVLDDQDRPQRWLSLDELADPRWLTTAPRNENLEVVSLASTLNDALDSMLTSSPRRGGRDRTPQCVPGRHPGRNDHGCDERTARRTGTGGAGVVTSAVPEIDVELEGSWAADATPGRLRWFLQPLLCVVAVAATLLTCVVAIPVGIALTRGPMSCNCPEGELLSHPRAEAGDGNADQRGDGADDRPRGGVGHRTASDDAEALQRPQHAETGDDDTETQDDYAHGSTVDAVRNRP